MFMDVKVQAIDKNNVAPASSSSHLKALYVLDIFVILVMGCLLYYGASWQIFRPYTDAAKYDCYAAAFWHGIPDLHWFPNGQCNFITNTAASSHAAFINGMQRYGFPAPLIQFVASQSNSQPFHALPHEYPFLTLIPFSFGLIVPIAWSQVAFAIGMILIAALIYIMLARFRSRRAAIASAFYLVAGCWATAAGRYDLFPAILTLGAVILAAKERWKWAFAFLALATLLKYYPALLLPPFLIAQRRSTGLKWSDWRLWVPSGVFVAVCVVLMGVSLLLSVEGTLGPFGYFGSRPVQVESFASSLIWLSSLIRPQHLQFVYTFGSLNVLSSRAGLFSALISLSLVLGLLYTFWLQWRAKIDLATSVLLVLLIIMITGKVFSPQYLIWILPLVAYVGESDWRWILSWGVIGLLTTWIYPTIYTMAPLVHVAEIPVFYPVVTTRNLVLLGFIVWLLVRSACQLPQVENVALDNQGQDVAGPA
jgi:hypothetical protein